MQPQGGIVDVDGKLGEHGGDLVLVGAVADGLAGRVAWPDRDGHERAHDPLDVLVA